MSHDVNHGEAPNLQLLTFSDLVMDIEASLSAARLKDKKEAWGNLLSLTQTLKSSAEGIADPTVGSPWNLTSVTVAGFQGATNNVIMKFDPSPGIMIIHGPNGSGKSTIADGIRTALSGSTRWWTSADRMTIRSMREPLWEKVHNARDATETLAEVILARASERLILSCSLDVDGNVSTSKAEWTNAEGLRVDVDLDSTSWPHALAGHPPVFSYADVERHVQQSNDLQQYIQNLLALGGCFTALNLQVTTLGQRAEAAKKLIEFAAKEAKQKIQIIDTESRIRDTSSAVVDIKWPAQIEDVDLWLEENDLSDTGGPLPRITEGHSESLSAACESVVHSLKLVDESPESVKGHLASSLRSLNEHVVSLDHVDEECPVCDETSPGWEVHLRDSLETLSDLEPIHADAEKSLSNLKRALERYFPDVLEVLNSTNSVRLTSDQFIEKAEREVRAYCQTLDTYGCQPTPRGRQRFVELQMTMESAEWRRAFAEAASLGAADRQWRQRRRSAVENFINVWRENSTEAKDHLLWQATGKCVKDLEGQLREKRSTDFTSLAGGRVKALLEDAGILLEDVRLTTKRAEVKVNNTAGQPLSLAMLSAGQRNAFLLAPLLATIDAGPFGFLVLDDPVHAFDDIRVDRLAAVLAEISEKRKVIVFTHDERLKQHLLARSLKCQAWAISRELDTGVISLVSTDELWRVLLDDAEEVCQLSPKISVTSYLTETQIIRGLCRQAIDNALHQCVIRHALSNDRDVAADIMEIDSCASTVARIDAAREIIAVADGVTHPVDRAVGLCGRLLKDWNNAVHGVQSTKNDLRSEISIARKACMALTGS